MWMLTSWWFQKCGIFWAWEFFNGSYCCSKSTDFEILGSSKKKRCRKIHGHNFELSDPPWVEGVVNPFDYPSYSWRIWKLKIVALSFFTPHFLINHMMIYQHFPSIRNLATYVYSPSHPSLAFTWTVSGDVPKSGVPKKEPSEELLWFRFHPKIWFHAPPSKILVTF